MVQKLKEVVIELGFQLATTDEFPIHRSYTWMILFVDDFFLIGPSEADIEGVKKDLRSRLDFK